jgi:hypothetical protein
LEQNSNSKKTNTYDTYEPRILEQYFKNTISTEKWIEKPELTHRKAKMSEENAVS